jgi:hypothetical protein
VARRRKRRTVMTYIVIGMVVTTVGLTKVLQSVSPKQSVATTQGKPYVPGTPKRVWNLKH